MKKSRTMAAALALSLCIGLLAGCQSGGASQSQAGGSSAPAGGSSSSASEQQPAAPAKISWCESDQAWGTAKDPELQQAFIDFVEEKTNLEIEPIIPPHSSVNEKLATMVSSGDAPDVFRVYQAMQRLANYAVRETIIPLDDYIAQSEGLQKIDPALYDYIKVNGKTYYIPTGKPQTKAIYLRQDIAEQYGITLSETPSTEEFVTEMKKLVGTDVIPFCFPKWLDNFQFFYNSFGAYGGIYKNADGVYVDGFQSKEMDDALLYIKRLYDEKIMDQEFITNENAKMRENVYNGTAASSIDYTTNFTNYNVQAENAGKPTEILPLYQLVGPGGEGGGLNEAIGTALVVSSKCKDPDAAMRLIEFIATDPEGIQAAAIGIEGKHFTRNADGSLTPTEAATASGYNLSPSFLYTSVVDLPDMGIKWGDTIDRYVEKQKEVVNKGVENYGPCYAVPAGLSDSFDRVSASIKETREAIASKVVVGTATLEEAKAEYASFWKSINGDKILEELNANA